MLLRRQEPRAKQNTDLGWMTPWASAFAGALEGEEDGAEFPPSQAPVSRPYTSFRKPTPLAVGVAVK